MIKWLPVSLGSTPGIVGTKPDKMWQCYVQMYVCIFWKLPSPLLLESQQELARILGQLLIICRVRGALGKVQLVK